MGIIDVESVFRVCSLVGYGGIIKLTSLLLSDSGVVLALDNNHG